MKKKEQIEIVRNPNLPYINHEIKFPIGNTIQSAFMQYGFYNQTVNRQVVHTHSYTEIHAFIGEATIYIDDIAYSLNGSNIVLIPKPSAQQKYPVKITGYFCWCTRRDSNPQPLGP